MAGISNPRWTEAGLRFLAEKALNLGSTPDSAGAFLAFYDQGDVEVALTGGRVQLTGWADSVGSNPLSVSKTLTGAYTAVFAATASVARLAVLTQSTGGVELFSGPFVNPFPVTPGDTFVLGAGDIVIPIHMPDSGTFTFETITGSGVDGTGATPSGGSGGYTPSTGTPITGLTWAPPDTTGFEPITVPADGGPINMRADTDYVLSPPSGDEITGPVSLNGGRNVVWKGGIHSGRTSVPSGTYDSSRRGIRISDSSLGASAPTRVVFLEGHWFKPGTYLSDGIQIALRKENNTIVVLQNIRIDATNYGQQSSVHADAIQAWGGPMQLLVDGFTAKNCTYQGFYLDPADGRSMPTGSHSGWVFRRVNLAGSSLLGGAKYLLAIREPGYASITNDRVYTIGQGHSATDGFGSWPSSGLTQSANPPGGDWVPSSLWSGGTYTSPGYG